MQTINFRVTVVEEYDVVEICGALKVSSCVFVCVCVWWGEYICRATFTLNAEQLSIDLIFLTWAKTNNPLHKYT